MKAINIYEQGTNATLRLEEVEEIQPGLFEVKIDVSAAGVNRADLLQKMGKYPPPNGVSPILGLEVAGVIIEKGDKVSGFNIGDRVIALLSGGGYAEQVIVDYRMLLSIPTHLSYVQAAAIPEVFLTAYQCLYGLAKLVKAETLLVHAGASGVGSAAIQLALASEAKVLITAGSDEKIKFCEGLGAFGGCNYRVQPSFDYWVNEVTLDAGAHVILDCVGGSYLSKNINCAALDARIVLIAFMENPKAHEVSLPLILQKRLTIMGSTLRARSLAYKAELIRQFKMDFESFLKRGIIKPVIDTVLPWTNVAQAHEILEKNQNMGKVILHIKD